MFVLSISAYGLIAFNQPHGDWDAWGIWNMRARFIFRGGEDWTGAFSGTLRWSHPDYPLLIPDNVARIWAYLGRDSVSAPIAIAFLFTFGTLALLAGSVASLRSRNQGLLAGLTLMCFASFIRYGAGQCADIPLGFYYLATLVPLHLADQEPDQKSRYLFLAGAMAGCSVWTKNEGVVFIVAMMLAHFAGAAINRGWRAYPRELLALIAGLAPVLIVLAAFKLRFPFPNHMTAGQLPAIYLERILDASRYLAIAKSFLITLLKIAQGAILIFPLAGLMLGFSWRQSSKKSGCISLIALALTLAGYFAAYLVSPHDLDWHLRTSNDRLFMQLLPGALFVFFILLRTPEEITAISPES
ncbi:glycosyltransferase family 39 protein [Candidatus Sumerlaeota bacterium]|nr:glycosyltransferase family 39 protein [Candidatus Sumerlaeota bacterium]